MTDSKTRFADALREIAEFHGAPCSFKLCNRPATLAECVDMLTCHVCWASCIAVSALAEDGEAGDETLAKIEDARSVCETLSGKLAQGNVEGALTEIEWLAARLADV